MTEIGIVYAEISHTCRHLKRWAKPKRAKTAMTHIGSKGTIYREPYGSVLIIAPWNYPFQLVMSPLIGAIAGGNAAVVKPSELSPAVSSVVAAIIGEAFPFELVTVIEGDADVSTELLKQPFDYIFFTGSVHVGKIVMEAAAKRLIPVTLELGGKSPCIVHTDADLRLAAKRIMFGKLTNAGQTCVAPDYLLVHRDIQDKLIAELKAAVLQFYGEAPLMNPDYGSIISRHHYERLVGFLDSGVIAFGGDHDEDTLKIAPTIMENVSTDAAVMKEEIFGPILPVITYGNIDEAVSFVTERPKPLALYLFTADRHVQREVLSRTSFGGGCVNDTLMHVASPYLPFGGVGESGIGNYHGKSSFETFTHAKSVLKQTNRFDLSFRYTSPHKRISLDLLRKIFK